MPTCVVPNCMSGRGKAKGVTERVRLYPFPESLYMRNRWIRQLHRDPYKWQTNDQTRICNLHFEDWCFLNPEQNKTKHGRVKKIPALKSAAVPTEFDFLPVEEIPFDPDLIHEGANLINGVMPSCVVPGCVSGRGKARGDFEPVMMFPFPEDEQMRNRWIRQMHQDPDKWQPNSQTRICNRHFKTDCFQLAKDKRGRLRKRPELVEHAVPSINFKKSKLKKLKKRPGYREPSPIRHIPEILASLKAVQPVADVYKTEHNYFSGSKPPRPVRFQLDESQVEQANNAEAQRLQDESPYLNKKHQKHEESEMKRLKQRNEVLERELAAFKRIFNYDQIRHIIHKSAQWTNETAENALKIRYACGDFGYDYLRACGYPFPCLKILDSKVSDLKIKPEVLDECTQMMKEKGEQEQPQQRREEYKNEQVMDVKGFDELDIDSYL